jgi:predicted nucleic acid-binding protein
MKLLIDEPGADEASAIWSRARLAVSTRLLYPEARAALGAAARDRRLGPGRTPTFREKLDALAADVAYVEVTPALAARAGDLAEQHALRGHDAVHLSSALEIDAADTVLVTGDGRLAGAAQALGLTTARLAPQSSPG